MERWILEDERSGVDSLENTEFAWKILSWSLYWCLFGYKP